MKIRIKLDCVVDMPHIPLLEGPALLDFVERAIQPFNATQIYPGTRLEFKRVNPRGGGLMSALHREMPEKKIKRARKKKTT